MSSGPSKPPGKPPSKPPGSHDDPGRAGEAQSAPRGGRKRRTTLGDWPPAEHTPPGTRPGSRPGVGPGTGAGTGPGVNAAEQTREFHRPGQESGRRAGQDPGQPSPLAPGSFDADAIELELDRDLGALELALPGDEPHRAAPRPFAQQAGHEPAADPAHGSADVDAAASASDWNLDAALAGWLDDWSAPTAPTRETAARQGFEVEPTRDMNHHAFTDLTLDDEPLALDDLLDGDWPEDPELIERRLIDELDLGATAGESPGDRERRRVNALIDQAHAQYIEGRLDVSVIALDLTWAESPDSVVSQKLIQEHRDTICEIYEAYIGDTEAVLAVSVSMNELRSARVDPRAAFLLSRVDGMLTVEELLDVAGMPRVETLRYLCALLAKGLVKVT